MQIWIHDSKMKKIVALNNDIPDMLSYSNSAWHPYLDQATSTFDFTIPKFSNGELHEDIKLINDECFVSFYVNGSYQVFYIATLQEDDFNIQLTCNNTNLEYALEYANPFSSESAQTIEWYLNHMDLLSFAAVEIGFNEISDRQRTLTFDSQETKMNRLQSLMSKFEAEFEFKVELNRDGTYKRIVINIYQKDGIGTDRKDVILYYSNGLKGVQVTSDKTQMFNEGEFTGKDGLNLANVEISEKNSDGIVEFYSPKGNPRVYAPLSMQRYPATMRPDGQDNWIRKDFQTEYENVNDLKAYALRTLKQYAYPLITYTATVQSGFVSQYTDLKLGDTIRIIDNNFVGGLALEARVSEMIISFDNPANNSFVFTNYRKIDNKPSAALQTRIEQVVESKLPYRIELATTGGVTFKNNEGETIVKPSLYKGNLPCATDVTWSWALDSVVTVGTQYRVQAKDITDSEVLTVAAYVGNIEVATTEITLTNVNDGKKSSYYSDTFPEDNPKGTLEKGDSLFLTDGDTVKQYYWNGTEWVVNPIASDVEALKKQIAEDLKDVPNREEFENKIAEELANSKAEIETQIETAKTQAESSAKEYADTINQETAKVAEQAKTAADEIKADLVNVKDNLTATSLVANNAQAAVDEAKQELAEVNTKVDSAKAELTQAKQDLTEVASDLNTAKQDLTNSVTAVNAKVDSTKAELTQAKQDLVSHAQQLQTQANAQTELTKRVTTVETTANGTKTTVNELTKTVAQNGKDITSVTNRTKTVEDDLANTKTTLTQVQTTANSASQKTATLETGLNGLSAKFDSLKIGGRNLLVKTNQGRTNWSWRISSGGTTAENYDADGVNAVKLTRTSDASFTWQYIAYEGLIRKLIEPNTKYTLSFDVKPSVDVTFRASLKRGDDGAWLTDSVRMNKATANKWTKVSCVLTSKTTLPDDLSQVVYLSDMPVATGNWLIIKNIKLEKGNVATDYSPSEIDLEQKVAEYKQNADQNYASLSSTVQTLDGQVQSNKTTAEQTAQGFKTRIESLETYKNGESERANAYFESAKTETAKQLTIERTAIANNYVAKSTYTSDVTGIRNELSATTTTANTTKTNLANYQASNDKAVANLQSNLQTANGNISSLQTKVEAVPGQITSAVSAVESKIPTSVGLVNLFKGSRDFSGSWINISDSVYAEDYKGVKIFKKQGVWSGVSQYFEVKTGEEYVFSAYVKSSARTDGVTFFLFHESKQPMASGLVSFGSSNNQDNIGVGITDNYKRIAIKIKITKDGWIMPRLERSDTNAYLFFGGYKLERGTVATDWSPAYEDTAEQISSLSSQIQQTADGITLLATKTELNSAKTELQSGIKTATDKANNNAQTISRHTTQISALNTGLSAKVSQTDFNTLSGRVTTAENNIIAKANELSSKITSVEGKIPTSVGATNLLLYSVDPWKAPDDYYQFDGVTKTDEKLNGAVVYKTRTAWSSLRSNWGKQLIDRKNVKVGEEFTYSVWVKTDQIPMKIRLYCRFLGQSGADRLADDITLTNEWQKFSITFKLNEKMVASQTKLTWVGFEQTTNCENGKYVYYACNKLERGNIATGYSPAPEDTTTQISSLSSEFKQTTDAIKASVSSLDNSTVKSSSLTINTDGVVIKAGKSTSDFANAVGSYFSVNQNAINLFSDKINVKGNMIVSGAITSDKIASKQINTAHLNGKIITSDVISSNAVTADAIKAGAVTTDKMSANSINGDRITAGTLDAAKIKAGSITASQIASGTITSAQIKTGTISAANIAAGAITGDNIKANSVDVTKIVGIDADYIKAKIEYAMIDWLKGKTITAYNDNMTIDLQNGRISFKDGSNAVYRQTPDGIHTGFLHFEAGSQGGIYAAFGATSTRQGINSKSSEFAGIRCYRVSAHGDSHDAKIDKIEVVGDTVQFGHGYRSDGSIGGGFIMDTAAFANETPYSFNRVIKSIDALWRILHDHAKNTGYRFDDSAFISALNNEYNSWHDMHNV